MAETTVSLNPVLKETYGARKGYGASRTVVQKMLRGKRGAKASEGTGVVKQGPNPGY